MDSWKGDHPGRGVGMLRDRFVPSILQSSTPEASILPVEVLVTVYCMLNPVS